MKKVIKNRLGSMLHILYPGDYYATVDNCILGSIVGISVVVCLYDKRRGIGGMGHFIIPGAIGTEGIISGDIARVGVINMEYLMGEIVKLGGDRKDLKAKLFGAGYIASDSGIDSGIIQGNMQFLNEYFKMENIDVERDDMGGSFRRKIYFYPKTGIVYRKQLKSNEESSEFIRLEREYIDRVIRSKDTCGEVILF